METIHKLRRLAHAWVHFRALPEAKTNFIAAVREARPIDVAEAISSKGVMRFEITTEQANRAYEWYDSIAKRDNRGPFDEGAMGGGLSFRFCMTNLGTIVSVEDALSGEHLTLTDFSDW